MSTHRNLDQRSLALHRLVAEKIRQDQSLLLMAQSTLTRWRCTASPRTFVYLDAWQQLLNQGMEVCLAAATEESERGDALRQASPLSCLLSPRDRFAFLKQWSANHATQ